jgi:hypothetical protein
MDRQPHGRADVNSPGNGEPFSMCMVCLAEVGSDLSACPKCHVPVSLVRKCPGCSKILSSLHEKCVYCGYRFVLADAVVSGDTTEPRSPYRRDRIRAIRAAAVSIGVFTVVFTVVLIFSHRLEQRTPAPRPLSRVATSYAVRSAPIYRSSTMDSVAIGHVPAATKVEVVDFETAGTTPLWWHVKTNGLSGYVRPSDFAPPRVVEPERGYFLLRSSISGIDDPETMNLAIEAVRYYRTTFPKNAHGDELLYWTAEQARQVAEKSSDAELLARAREMFTLLTPNTDFSQKARTALENFPTIERSHSDRSRKQSRAPDIEIVGAVRHGRSSAESAQKLALINETEILVVLPSLQPATAGMMLQGHTAREIKAGDVVIPAGSVCDLKVVALAGNGPASSSSVLIQMTGLQVSGRRVTADGVPTLVPIPLNGATNPPAPPVSFRLKTPLLILQ